MAKGKSKTVAKKKTDAASRKAHQAISKLFSIAVGAPTLSFESEKSAGRLYELVVLETILAEWRASGPARTVELINAPGGVMKFAGAPASAKRDVFSYFSLLDNGAAACEAWIGVQISTLSWLRSPQAGSRPLSATHEIDVGFFRPEIDELPSFQDLYGAFSCKHQTVIKEHAREALGLRRETALLCDDLLSRMEWLQEAVPANPPSPLYLVGSTPSVLAYADPLWTLGVYTRYVPFADD